MPQGNRPDLRAQRVQKNDANREAGAIHQTRAIAICPSPSGRRWLCDRQKCGFDVPKEAIDEAVRYIKRCYQPDDERRNGEIRPGGFGYQNRGRELSTTSEGLLALMVCGDYNSDEVRGASERLLRDGIKQGERWFFYTTYYYAQKHVPSGEASTAEEGRRVVADVSCRSSHGGLVGRLGRRRARRRTRLRHRDGGAIASR
jgi:hypothetical protein